MSPRAALLMANNVYSIHLNSLSKAGYLWQDYADVT